MNISYLLGRSSQAPPSGDTGLHATDIADFSLEATAHRLRHYRDIQLPGMTGKVSSLKELTHPSKLNKRSHSSKVGGEGVELEEEPSRQRRRFDNTEVKGYLAGLKRKQMLLRQDSNPQEVPGSPVLPLHLSSSSAGFRVDEMGGEYSSLHHNSEFTLADAQPGPVSTKELVSIMREDSKITAAGYGAAGGGTCSFPTRSPTTSSTLNHHPPQFSSMISELDPSLEHLLGGTVSPAVASTPSPNATTTTTATKTSRSPIASSSSPPPPIPPMSSIPSVQQLHRYLDASEGEGEIMTDIICDGEGKEEECPETASVGVVAAAGGGDDDQELVEDLSEMPILPSFRDQGQLHTSPTSLPYVLPNDPPPPSLSLLLSQAFSNHNTITYPSQANLHSDTRGSHHERFDATTFSISQYYPREE